jgi:O-antigen/teichoic acid export membrane protein
VYLARTLGPEGYGVVAVAAGVMLYLTQIADAGVELAGMTEAASGPAGATAVARGAIVRRLWIVAVVLAVIVPSGWWGMAQPDGRVLALFALGLPFTAVSVRWIHLALHQPATVARSRIASDVVTAALTFAMVRSTTDLYWVPVAALVGIGVGTAWLHAGLGRLGVRLDASSDPARVDAMLARGRRLALFLLLGLVLYNVDLLLLRALKGEADSGRYAAAYVLISFCANLVIGYTLTVLPVLAKDPIPTAATAAAFASSLVAAWMATVPVAIGGALVSPVIIALLFGTAYADAAVALQVLVLSVPVSAVREVAVAALLARQQESTLLRVNGISAAANIALNLALIPFFGLAGAAWATVGTEVVRTGMALAAAKAALPGPLPLGGVARVALAGLGMGVVVVASGTRASLLAIAVGAIAYPLLLALTGAVRIGGAERIRVTTS